MGVCTSGAVVAGRAGNAIGRAGGTCVVVALQVVSGGAARAHAVLGPGLAVTAGFTESSVAEFGREQLGVGGAFFGTGGPSFASEFAGFQFGSFSTTVDVIGTVAFDAGFAFFIEPVAGGAGLAGVVGVAGAKFGEAGFALLLFPDPADGAGGAEINVVLGKDCGGEGQTDG